MTNTNQENKDKFRDLVKKKVDGIFDREFSQKEVDGIIMSEVGTVLNEMAVMNEIGSENLRQGIELAGEVEKAESSIKDLKRIADLRQELDQAA